MERIIRKITPLAPVLYKKKRVAAYARVSSDKEAMLHSLSAQVSYYSDYIQQHSEWEYAGVYADEALTGTRDSRPDFQRMLSDCRAGLIDVVITKSISRFARNTVTMLETLRELRQLDVDVYFEKENIYTLDSKGELLITIMSSLAQEESRSISENVTWGQRKRMADGKVSMPYRHFLGYEKGEDGLPKIVEKEAETVRLIYRMFLEGKTPSAIAKHLGNLGIPSPAGKKTWQVATVISILTNEKYKGDALLQKRFTVDFLTKTTKVNEGEVPQYYVQNSHPAIIEPDEFDAVQLEMERRKKLGRPVSCHSPFSAKIVCGECGGFYGSKVWGSNTKYRRTVWRCNEKYKNDKPCSTPHITEDEIKQRFLKAFNILMSDRDEVLTNCRLAQEVLCDCSAIETELAELHREIEVVSELMRKSIYENARFGVNQDEYNQRYQGYIERHRIATERVAELEDMQRNRQNKSLTLERFIREIETRPLVIEEFDESLWLAAIDKVIVHGAGDIQMAFRDGTVIR